MSLPEIPEDTSVSFDPGHAVPVIPGSGASEYAADQVTRPPTVIYTLGIRCVCGVRLCGCQYWFFSDTLHVRGVCLRCGEQDVIFVPPRVEQENEARQIQQLEAQDVLLALKDITVSETALREENERLRAQVGMDIATHDRV